MTPDRVESESRQFRAPCTVFPDIRGAHRRFRDGIVASLAANNDGARTMRVSSAACGAAFHAAICAFLCTALPKPCSAAITIDLSYVDQESQTYQRFRDWVDEAVDGNPDYGFSATDAA